MFPEHHLSYRGTRIVPWLKPGARVVRLARPAYDPDAVHLPSGTEGVILAVKSPDIVVEPDGGPAVTVDYEEFLWDWASVDYRGEAVRPDLPDWVQVGVAIITTASCTTQPFCTIPRGVVGVVRAIDQARVKDGYRSYAVVDVSGHGWYLLPENLSSWARATAGELRV